MSVRVLIVDDSPTMRGLLRNALSRDPDIEIVGGANDPYEAREAIKSLKPDVLTLDVEMPRMNGIEFLEKLMRLHPLPVVMVSTLTHRGADAALQALELGAVDCVGKPTDLSRGDLFHELAQRVKQAAKANVRAREVRAVHAPVSLDQTFSPNGKLVAIGASTGGVEALQTFLGDYPENCPATLIVQHMPESFLPQFADRLNASCRARVEIAADGAPLRSGRVYVAPGGADHLEVSGRVERVCRLAQGDLIEGHRPSVDALFGSIARVSGGSAIGVLLTGMGRDGAAGLKAMRDAGAYTLVQDEFSSTVYGMPRAAMALNAAVKQAPLERLAPLVLAAAAATKESV